jgi:hypothetical protein
VANDDLIERARLALDPDILHSPGIFREIVRELLERLRQGQPCQQTGQHSTDTTGDQA